MTLRPTEVLDRFARIMQQRYGATLYLFGSRGRGAATPDSDFDIVAVSQVFQGTPLTARVLDRWSLWLDSGGWGLELDLHCYTPEEFRKEIAGELGYLGQAKLRGELKRIPLRKARRAA